MVTIHLSTISWWCRPCSLAFLINPANGALPAVIFLYCSAVQGVGGWLSQTNLGCPNYLAWAILGKKSRFISNMIHGCSLSSLRCAHGLHWLQLQPAAEQANTVGGRVENIWIWMSIYAGLGPFPISVVAVKVTGAISVAEIGAFSLVNQPGPCPLIGF